MKTWKVKSSWRYYVPDRDDSFALITLALGQTRRHEFHHGSTYLSQSSRIIRLPPGTTKIVIVDFRGHKRERAGELLLGRDKI